MTLYDIQLPITEAWGKAHALVFTPALAGRLAELHRQHGSQNCVPMPLQLVDGRLMLCADILTEVMPGGLLAGMWEVADKELLNKEVEVIPWNDALLLLPQDPIIIK